MKQQVATLLLICYTALLLRPLVPVVEDVVSHIFREAEHIATVHLENGKYHVHLEINEAQEKSGDTSKPFLKQIEPFSAHLTTGSAIFGLALNCSERLVDDASLALPHDGHFIIPFSPPRIC